MIISLAEFVVLVDALSASTRIADNGYYYNYSQESRRQVWQSLHKRMNGEPVDVGDLPVREEGKP